MADLSRSLSSAGCPVQTVSTGYQARPQFVPLHMRTQRWAITVAHRRAGKTVACINDLIDACLRCSLPEPRFAYVAPLYAQAKDVAWAYLKQFTAAIPGVQTNESELRVDLPGGRRIRLYGADNYERLRGLYFDGIVLDEFGDMDPRAWQEVIRASLADRHGWAVFIGTPKGLNHFADAWRRAATDDAWMTLRLRASETGLISEAELADARKEMSEDQYLAEFECSFEASVVGAFYGREMKAAADEGRICRVPYQPGIAVDTWWDLGVRDAAAIIMTQNIGREVHVIDYAENSGEGLPGCVRELQARPYVWGKHNAPHDIQVRDFGTGKSRIEQGEAMGFRFEIVPDIGRMDGINAARNFIASCYFDEVKCGRLVEALTSYHKVWDEKRKTFQAEPYHDWSSNGADAFRYLSVGHKLDVQRRAPIERRRLMVATGEPDGRWMAS